MTSSQAEYRKGRVKHLICLYLVPAAAVTNHHKLGGLEQQKFIPSVLEARGMKSRWPQGHTLSEGSKELPSAVSS